MHPKLHQRPPGHPEYRHPTIVNIKTTMIHDALYTQFQDCYYKNRTVEVSSRMLITHIQPF